MSRARCLCEVRPRNSLGLRFSIALLAGSVICLTLYTARADEAQDNAAAAKKDADKPDSDKSAKEKKKKADSESAGLGQRRDREVGKNEELSFQQAKVAAEMRELEERMFRLSEAIKKLEPENSSRLVLGLKYARQELIEHQMKEIQKLLDQVEYSTAAGEQKEVLVKLQRLEQLLLSLDLDLQLQLERLRMLREAIRQLDLAIKEEEREIQASKDAADQQEAKKDVGKEKFAEMQKDQEKNRNATDQINDLVRQLGDRGAGAVGELSRASSSMSSAESQLANSQAGQANKDQSSALASLKYARQQLAEQEQQLLNQIRAEVKRRVIEGLTEMIEKQEAVRQATERLGPKIKDGSRQVLTAVVGLAKQEEKIIQIGDELIALVEETEFGIALPAAMRAVVQEMDEVKRSLASGDASESVVAAEKQIEEDLKALLDAMKQLPSSSPPSNKKPKTPNPEDQERELNRLIAELKMIRILQVRVKQDTSQTEPKRAAELNSLSTSLKQKIQAIHDRQQDVHDLTERLNAERGGEL